MRIGVKRTKAIHDLLSFMFPDDELVGKILRRLAELPALKNDDITRLLAIERKDKRQASLEFLHWFTIVLHKCLPTFEELRAERRELGKQKRFRLSPELEKNASE